MYRLVAILVLWPMLAFGQITAGPQLNTNGSGIGSLTVQGTTGPYLSLPMGTTNAVGWGAPGGIPFDPLNTDASITLWNANHTATPSNNGWRSTITIGSGKTSGKWYFRLKTDPSQVNFVLIGWAAKTTPTGNLIGGDASGWGGYVLNNNPGSIINNNVNLATVTMPALAAPGDYLVAAYDATNGKLYYTTMTAAGVLNTNWNGTSANPSTNIGGVVVTVGTALQPGASFLGANSGPMTIDTTTPISNSTLSGFSLYPAQ